MVAERAQQPRKPEPPKRVSYGSLGVQRRPGYAGPLYVAKTTEITDEQVV